LQYDTSVAQGQQILDSTILQQVAGGHVDAASPVVVFGWSQSSGISSLTMSQLASQGVPSDDVHFVLVGDTNNPNGGLFDRFDGLADTNPSLAGIGFTLGGGPTPDDLYPTDVYTNEYDVVADFPRYPIDVLSDLNAALGIIQHIPYPALTPEQIASATLLPGSAALTGEGLANFYMIPAETLPLLFPLQLIPFIGQPLYDLLEPDMRILVNLGYGNIENGWDPGPANVATPFGLFPTDINWGDVLTALGSGLQQGITDAIEQLQNPDNYKISTILENPLLSQLVTVVHDFGFTDATDISQLLNLPALLEVARNGLGQATGFPTSDVSLFSSSPTEIINDLTGTVSADYATLLPVADGINALLTSVPAYDVSVIEHQLEAGSLLGALTDPLIADEVLALFGPFLAGASIAVAAGGTLVNLADLFGLGG
ncbi:MAG: PE-PPE domain-containing protein, partial [Mycobacterium sp.]